MEWLPNFFIAGFPKSGTSSLHGWLADHPQALGSRVKETCFFADPGSHVFDASFNVAGGLEAYRAQFEPAGDAAPRVIFESTPTYAYSRTALREIPALASAPRCLFVLRDPADQIRSVHDYYRNNWSMIPADMDLAHFVAAVRRGGARFDGNELCERALENARYAEILRPWREALGEERFRVVTFERLRADPRGLMREICDWLGIDPDFYDDYAFPRENVSYHPRLRNLQRLNIAVRGALPKGRLYDMMRALYRRANTRVPAGASPADTAVMAQLRKDFAAPNAELARDFGIDVSGWTG